MVSADDTALFLFDNGRRRLYSYTHDSLTGMSKRIVIDANEGVVAFAMQSKEAIHLEHVASILHEGSTVHMLVCPVLNTSAETVSCIVCERLVPSVDAPTSKFTHEDEVMLRLIARHTSASLKAATSFETLAASALHNESMLKCIGPLCANYSSIDTCKAPFPGRGEHGKALKYCFA